MSVVRDIGFTGTQRGMTAEQVATVRRLLAMAAVTGPIIGHHGDCIGADAQFHDLVRELRDQFAKITVHPPTDPAKRAWRDGDVILPPAPYLERNHTIVDMSYILLATPGEPAERVRSGTWSTVRYARKVRRRHIVITPNGFGTVFAEDGRCWPV